MNSFRQFISTGLVSTTVLFAASVIAQTPPGESADTVAMTASLSPKSEIPPVTASGSGSVEATFNKKSRQLTYTITYKDLTGTATAGHFHGPAPVGKNAGVAVPLKGSIASPVKGGVTLNEAQTADLLAGLWYVNVHTAANPEGEIRGQLVTQQ
jgi:hypothetical protein